ncbi:hypothetical protein FEM03_04975 [Phragmitibacter flavus]|uniref:Secretory protein n=1 Tax=Phragmitibacter flavus TaxID=2576071 RepID=A0A5R8KIH2_9BACT|nr:basic secretory protein-like protein [Phragmitibacter flavus]TLD72082.1 hypothetical protein FEM03_04975 [Phragmitibacter flavus]
MKQRCPVVLILLVLVGSFAAAKAKPVIVVPALLEPLSSKELVVHVDCSQAPECEAWGQQAKAMVELWFPIIATYLDTPGWRPPPEILLIFLEMKGVAHASGHTIHISRDWIKKQPQDIGMVLHEMVHVIQGYPPQKEHWWLVEGIADYIRFWKAEPGGQPKINRGTDHYRKGYRVTGAFLAWIETTHAPLIVQEANLALRRGTYSDALFKKKTGMDLDALWTGFLTSLEGANK